MPNPYTCGGYRIDNGTTDHDWGTHCEEDSLTQQSFTQDADINVLARRFGMTNNKMPEVIPDPRLYGDYSNAPDLKTALDIIRDASAHFNQLPPELRFRFQNSPAHFWEFVHNPNNRDEGIRLGIFNPPAPPETPPTPATPVS